MSNKNSKGFMGIFKKFPKRESDNGDIDIRRSRSFATLDPLSIKPNEGHMDHKTDLEALRKEEEKAELQRLEREQQLQLEKQKAVKIRQQGRIQERERLRKREMERKREIERTRNMERQKNLDRQKNQDRSKYVEPSVSKVSLLQEPREPREPREPKELVETKEDFQRDIENLEHHIGDLDFRSKMMATMWMNRLRSPVQTDDEARARNIITAHLVKCRNENIFKKEPFNLPPTSDDLETIREKMSLTTETLCNDMTLANQRETNSYLNQLFHDSYDGGEFLSQLPVPRDGAFFILHMRPNLQCNEI